MLALSLSVSAVRGFWALSMSLHFVTAAAVMTVHCQDLQYLGWHIQRYVMTAMTVRFKCVKPRKDAKCASTLGNLLNDMCVLFGRGCTTEARKWMLVLLKENCPTAMVAMVYVV